MAFHVRSNITRRRYLLPFRQAPPIACFSSQFLFYLNSPVADTAYQTWSHLIPQAQALFPPERFHFDVLNIS